MAFERQSQATLGIDPHTGRHGRPTNMADVIADAELPDALCYVAAPAPQTHGAPPTENPYYRPNEEK